MNKFPVDASAVRVKRALELLGFRVVREGNHISMIRENADGTRTPFDYAQPRETQVINTQDHLDASRHTPR